MINKLSIERPLDISRGRNTAFHLKCCIIGVVTPFQRTPRGIWGLTIGRSRVFFLMRFEGVVVVFAMYRKGRNTATREDMILAPRRVVHFMCSGKLRDRVNGER